MNVVFFEIAGIIGVFFGIGASIRLLGKSLGWDEAIVYVGAVFRDPGNQRIFTERNPVCGTVSLAYNTQICFVGQNVICQLCAVFENQLHLNTWMYFMKLGNDISQPAVIKDIGGSYGYGSDFESFYLGSCLAVLLTAEGDIPDDGKEFRACFCGCYSGFAALQQDQSCVSFQRSNHPADAGRSISKFVRCSG